MQRGPDSSRVYALDLLRFFAAASVMLYHYVSHEPLADGSYTLADVLTQHGYLGVDVFFMISGFVILWSAIGRTGAGFVRARVLRLYPEFWVAVCLSAAAWTILEPGWFKGTKTAYDIAANLTMLPRYLGAPMVDGVYWTLAVELKFYALVWLLLITGQLKRMETFLYGWLALFILAAFVDVARFVRPIVIYPHGVHFAAGGLFYLVYSNGWTKLRAIALALALVLCAYSSLSQMAGFMDAERVTLLAQVATVGILLAASGVFVAIKRLQRFSWPAWVVFVGALTYPLYLTHNIGKRIFINGPAAEFFGPVRHLVAIAFSLVLAWLVMRAAERFVKPGLKRALDGIGIGGSVRQRSLAHE